MPRNTSFRRACPNLSPRELQVVLAYARDIPADVEHLQSWAVVATADKAAGTDITRANAKRAGATITEIAGQQS